MREDKAMASITVATKNLSLSLLAATVCTAVAPALAANSAEPAVGNAEPQLVAFNSNGKKIAANTVIPESGTGLTVTSMAESADVALKRKQFTGRPKIGLALGGGGARGAAHIGALKVLEKEGIKFDVITGTSIGCVVGGLYAAGVPLEEMEKQFETGKLMKNFMTVPLTFRIAVAPIMVMPRLFGSKAYDGLYKGNKFRNYVKRDLSACEMDIEKLNVPFAGVSLNLLDGKPYMIRKGSLAYAMQASTAVPGLRKPVEIEDQLLCDGGVICNLPVKQCRELGADIVIAVNIDHPFGPKRKDDFRKLGSVAQWMLDWDLYSMDKPQADLADITIHPDTSGISLVSRSKKDARRGCDAGSKAATELLPEIRKLLSTYGVEYGKTETATNGKSGKPDAATKTDKSGQVDKAETASSSKPEEEASGE